jgi:hypothetical protein
MYTYSWFSFNEMQENMNFDTWYIIIFTHHSNQRRIQPRSQALPSCWGKTLAGAGHVAHGNLIAQWGVGKVSNYMLPLPHFTLRLQGVSVLYNQLWESYKIQLLAKFGSCLLLNYKKHAKHIFIATDKSGSQAIKSYALKLFSCSFEASGALSFHTFLFCLWFTSHIYNILIICR